jgi:NAD(P)-dependent dehydrogenase (short-subunit alcohol dehydrogenase family)
MPQPSIVAVVTGASQGAGRGIALALGSHGCTVYVTGRSVENVTATAAAVTAAGGQGGCRHYQPRR